MRCQAKNGNFSILDKLPKLEFSLAPRRIRLLLGRQFDHTVERDSKPRRPAGRRFLEAKNQRKTPQPVFQPATSIRSFTAKHNPSRGPVPVGDNSNVSMKSSLWATLMVEVFILIGSSVGQNIVRTHMVSADAQSQSGMRNTISGSCPKRHQRLS
jgi:hypothetical protein